MPKMLLAFVLCGLTVVLASGCGSVANLASDQPKVYGGLACDPLLNASAATPGPGMNLSGLHGEGKTGVFGLAALVLVVPAIFVADISTNLVLDTITLPVAYYYQRKYDGSDWNPPPPEGPSQPERPLVLPTCLLEQCTAPEFADATLLSQIAMPQESAPEFVAPSGATSSDPGVFSVPPRFVDFSVTLPIEFPAAQDSDKSSSSQADAYSFRDAGVFFEEPVVLPVDLCPPGHVPPTNSPGWFSPQVFGPTSVRLPPPTTGEPQGTRLDLRIQNEASSPP